MRHSIYLTLATLLIKADLKREEREWQRTVRRSSHDVPHQCSFIKGYWFRS